jgi:drug/metabolite transporter (DMT)-like permease
VTAIELALVLVSALLHAIWSAAIKGAQRPLAFGALQHLAAVPFAAAALLAFEPGDLSLRVWALLACTGVAHGAYQYWMTQAYARAELSRVYPIVRSTPALLPLVALPLGEVLTPLGALGIAIVVAGVWLVYAEGDALRRALAPELVYAWLTLGATVAYSLFDKLAMAELGRASWHGPLPPALAWYALLMLASTPVMVPLALRTVGARSLVAEFRSSAGSALLAALVGLVGYGLILQVLRSAPASYVVAVRQLSVLFAVGIAVRFLGEAPSPRRLAGALLTVAGVATIAVAG